MIPEEIVSLQNGTLVAHVGTRNNQLQGRELHAWTIKIDAPTNQATIYVSEKLAAPTLANLSDNKKIAVAVTDPTTHNSYQLKGDYVSHHSCSDEEHARIKEFINRFYDNYLKHFGYPPEIADTFAYKPFIAITFTVNSIFNQTPGPNAGKQVNF